jgi:hypothetical protein
MAEQKLLLDLIQTEEEERTSPVRVRLVIKAYPSDGQGFISLTPECESLDEFEGAVEELRRLLDMHMEEAREAFLSTQDETISGVKAVGFQSPEEIWQALEERGTIEDMRELYNALSLNRRQEVADFVLTQLNIFKGAASVFSQHYNEAEYLLE